MWNLVKMSVVVWCLALWLVGLCLVLYGPRCWWHLLLVVLCGHQCTSAREWRVHLHLRWRLNVVCLWCAVVVYVDVSCFVVSGWAVSRRYINVWSEPILLIHHKVIEFVLIVEQSTCIISDRNKTIELIEWCWVELEQYLGDVNCR